MLSQMLPIIFLTAGLIIIAWRIALAANPSSALFKVFERLTLSLAGLTVWNWLTAPLGMALGINLTTLTTASLLGIPGVAVMAAVKSIL